ncbi:uncharacterized protein PAC_03588 [Phialocephala subalpina]|uniref:RNase H type-1 domain-containing protein n=1 Tax=Phialocephala subalpina TaxID=576137 RepID=A0A1L7WLR5_9HELO|nr:uncharacterized protein PAC_03588 [Phialocephala subalpina]
MSSLDRQRRLHDPSRMGIMLYDDPQMGVRRLHSDRRSIVISIDGYCARSGQPTAQCSFGVFSAPQSLHISGVVFQPKTPNSTSTSNLTEHHNISDTYHQFNPLLYPNAILKSELDGRDIGQALRSIRVPGRRPQGRRVPRRGLQTGITKRQAVPVKTPRTTRTFNIEQRGAKAYNGPESNFRRLESDPASIVIAVTGRCLANGSSAAQASYGIFVSDFAVNLNRHGIVPDPFPQTSQSAELYATIGALDVLQDLIIAGEDLSHVIIKTNSAYLQKGLSIFIWKWASNGLKNHEGKPVVNGRAFKFLHERVVLLEKEYGTRVSFCLVRKDQNQQADDLAMNALR